MAVYSSSCRFATGGWQRDYIYLNGQLLARISSQPAEGLLYVLNDQLGTPLALVDTSKTIRWSAKRYPFGEIYSEFTSATNDVGFPGQWRDDETGLYYNWFRYYDPVTGRYRQADPLGLDGGPNLYSYALSNPINLIDPFGLSVGEPSTLESLIPVWGSARQAINDFQTGHPVWGTINAIAAASDLFLVGSIRRVGIAVFKHGFKDTAWKFTGTRGRLGGHSWNATKSWYYKYHEKLGGHVLHHWLFERNRGIGKYVPRWIKNQPWNLKQLPEAIHIALDKKEGLSWLAKGWYSTPAWSKALGTSVPAHLASGMRGEDDCR